MEDLRVGLEVKSQLDKDRTPTNSRGGVEKQLKWDVEFDKDSTHTKHRLRSVQRRRQFP